MNTKLVALAVAGALSSPLVATAADPTPEHTFTGNVGLASEYLYRGIAQTAGKPALQGGFDYAHSSGFYAGIWGSNISWLENASASSASLEIDVYGGYKGAITEDFGYDVGILTYNYPGKVTAGLTKPDTQEIYGALTWKFLTLKYSHSISNLFGVADSKGSGYLELNASYDLGDGWGINGHIGHQKVKNFKSNNPGLDADYTDYKIGVTKDLGFGVMGLAVSGTNAKDSCSASEWYCFQSQPGGAFDYSAGKTRAVLTFGKTF